MSKNIQSILLSAFFAVVAGSAQAAAPCSGQIANPLTVFFSGFAFVGDSEESKVFKYTSQLVKKKDPDGKFLLGGTLKDAVANVHNPCFKLETGLADKSKGNDIVMGFAISWENVAVEKLGDKYLVVTDIHGTLLVVDFEEKRYIGAFPVRVQLRDLRSESPTDQDKLSTIEKLYLTHDYPVNVMDEVVKRLETIELKRRYSKYIQVTKHDGILEDKAKEMVKQYAPKDSVMDDFSNLVGETFTSLLAINQNLPIIPYNAPNGTMQAKFNDRSVMFKMPDPNSVSQVKLTLRGFKKVELGKTYAYTALGYGAFIHLHVTSLQDRENLNSRVQVLDAAIKDVLVENVPASQSNVDDWTNYQRSMLYLFDNVTKQITQRDGRWLKESSKNEDFGDQMESFAKLLDGLR